MKQFLKTCRSRNSFNQRHQSLDKFTQREDGLPWRIHSFYHIIVMKEFYSPPPPPPPKITQFIPCILLLTFLQYLLSQLTTLPWTFLPEPECREMQFGIIISLTAISDSFSTSFHTAQRGTYSQEKKNPTLKKKHLVNFVSDEWRIVG